MSAKVEIDLMIERLRKLPELAAKVAPDCARVVEQEIKRTTSAGTDPYGKPWEPRKADGSRPLVHAFEAVGVAAVGTKIFVVVRGINARHHRGAVKGKVKRRIIPTQGIPTPMAAGLRDTVSKAFLRVMSGG